MGVAGGLGSHQVTAQTVLDLLNRNQLGVAVGDVLAGGDDLLADLDAILVEVSDILSHLARPAEQLVRQVSVEGLDVNPDLVSRHHGRGRIDTERLRRALVLGPAQKSDYAQRARQYPTGAERSL